MANVCKIEMSVKCTMKMASFCKNGKVTEEYPCGTLLGLIDGETMEITDCFFYPTNTDEDMRKYKIDMLRCARTVNGDYLSVGWFTPSVHGEFVDHDFINCQAQHQFEDPDAVVLVYDPQKTVKGCLSMKAYRLNDEFLELARVEIERLNSDVMKLTKSTILVEIPIEVTSTPLDNILAQTLKARNPVPQNVDFSGLSPASYLEHQLKGVIQSVDKLREENAKFRQHRHSVDFHNRKKEILEIDREYENAERRALGQPLLPDVDLSKVKPPKEKPERLTATLAAAQLDNLAEDVEEISSQSLANIFAIKAMENDES